MVSFRVTVRLRLGLVTITGRIRVRDGMGLDGMRWDGMECNGMDGMQ